MLHVIVKNVLHLHCVAGKKDASEQEIDKVMYHDWHLIPKHEEGSFTCFQPLPEPPIRHVFYPPLLRAMMLAQQAKELSVDVSTLPEPSLPLKRDILLSKEYFRQQEQQKQEGSPV